MFYRDQDRKKIKQALRAQDGYAKTRQRLLLDYQDIVQKLRKSLRTGVRRLDNDYLSTRQITLKLNQNQRFNRLLVAMQNLQSPTPRPQCFTETKTVKK
mmetsp:Transcript_65197/g.175020  ORF Transcript_65197/g.175020 Transcript_65197/m.175020 type:complete len:99 (+) Transcript_65197:122-418(+)